MGCGASLPKPDDFLVPSSEDGAQHLVPGLSKRDERMVVRMNPRKGGKPIIAEDSQGKAILSFQFEQGAAFGSPILMRDSNDAVVGALKTAQRVQPTALSGWEETSFYIYGLCPAYDSQQVGLKAGSVDLYRIAKVTRKPFSTTVTVVREDGGGTQTKLLMTCSNKIGFYPLRYICRAANGTGLAIVGRSKERPKRHEFTIAPGADVAMVVCVTLAHKLLDDEIPSNNTGAAGASGGPSM
mmetsp:Transcript_41355/g.86620  ORF Transcript_41355/g.86620 Transcript_41355/m.86620 type:complete len:240 (+) Transcript_41355:175-894(+)|eukprot:1550789-Pleurochrysis_carterae.AAC.1